MRPGRKVLILAIACSLAPIPVAYARYTDSPTSTASFTADTLDPPTSLASSAPIGLTATLTWTATPDTYATGYSLFRSTTSGSGYTFVKSISGRTTTTTTDTPLVAGTYYYVLRSVGGSWSSVNSNQVSVLLI